MEQPAAGYPSDNENDEMPMEIVEEALVGEEAEEDDEPLLEEVEAVVAGDCCVPVLGTAASAVAAADAAIAARRASKGYERPNAAQKRDETKVASEARTAWVEAQWLQLATGAGGEAAGDVPLQCRNADALAKTHPLPGDGTITFVEEGHKYTAYGEAVHRGHCSLHRLSWL